MRFSLNFRLILAILSFVGIIIGGTMLAGLAVSLVYGESGMARIFLSLALALTGAGIFGVRYARRKPEARPIRIREGILSVTLCWVFAAALCSLPYLLAGSHHSFIDAFFESTACITTTGSTLVEDLAGLPKSLLFWRMLTNWLGGLGIIIFAITIIPMLGFGAANLATAEMPGLTFEAARARVGDIARNILLLYLALTGVEIMLLAMGGTGAFDAFILSFSSMGNGGFANYRTGMASGGAPGSGLYVDIIVAVFCVVAAMSFVSYQLLLKRRVREFFRETEIRLYLALLAVVCILVFVIVLAGGVYDTVGDAARYGIIQTISFTTTAGYPGVNVDAWPQAAHWLLFFAMIVGGCSGSTSGGIKVVRAAVAFSLIRCNIYKRLHPNAVVAIKLGGRTVPEDRVSNITTYIIMYPLIVLLSCFVLSFEKLDTETTLGAVLAMLSNTGLVIGPGVDIGDTFTVFSQFSRFFMSLLMIAGRLELLTFVLIFSPAFWRPNR